PLSGSLRGNRCLYPLSVVMECVMPKVEPMASPLSTPTRAKKITVAVRADDMQAGDTRNPERHPVAIALRRKRDVDDARVSRREVLIRRGDTWYRYDALVRE